jgi:hypothetical protein
MSVSIIGKDGTNIATTSNGLAVFTGDAAAAPAGVGAVRLFSENDAGAITGTPYLQSPETSSDYRLRVGMDTLLYDHTTSETAPDTTRLRLLGTFGATMTTTMASGFIALNASGASTASGNYLLWSTSRHFRIRGASQLYVEIEANLNNATLIANQIVEAGLFLPVVGVQPADGVWFQLDSSGLKGVVNYNGTITQTGVLVATLTPNKNYHWVITISDGEVEFWQDDVLLGTIVIPAGQASPCLTDCLPVSIQQRNSGIVSASGQGIFKFGNLVVTAGDLNYNKPFAYQMAGMGHMAYQAQAGATMGTTAAFANATAATTVTGGALSQTVTLATGLGGQIGITAAVPGIDGLIFNYTNPVGSISQPPRNLTITGIKISSVNIGAAVAITPSTISWSLAFGALSANLAVAEAVALTAATAKSFRRVPLGIQSWAVGALVGAKDADLAMTFQSPIVVFPGEMVAVVAKFIQGTATASQVIFTNVTFDAHFD